MRLTGEWLPFPLKANVDKPMSLLIIFTWNTVNASVFISFSCLIFYHSCSLLCLLWMLDVGLALWICMRGEWAKNVQLLVLSSTAAFRPISPSVGQVVSYWASRAPQSLRVLGSGEKWIPGKGEGVMGGGERWMAAGMRADGPPGLPAGPCGGAGGRVQHRATQPSVSTLGRSWESAEAATTWEDEVNWWECNHPDVSLNVHVKQERWEEVEYERWRDGRRWFN